MRTPTIDLDKIHVRLDTLHNGLDPCRRSVVNGLFSCISLDFPHGCCQQCQYQVGHCLAGPPLGCRMWICQRAFDLMPPAARKRWFREISAINDELAAAGYPVEFRLGTGYWIQQDAAWFIGDGFSLTDDGEAMSVRSEVLHLPEPTYVPETGKHLIAVL